jgi:hypothetical protein
MAIAVVASRNALATYYGSQASWINLATGDPGTTATPANEASGGSPANARKQTTWGTAAASAITGSEVTIDLAAGTYTHMLLATASSGATMFDKATITSTTLGSQGQVKLTPTYTQS